MTPFGQWLLDHGISYAAAARQLEITRAGAQALAVGKFAPGKELAEEIRDWTEELDPEHPIDTSTWVPYTGAYRRLQSSYGGLSEPK